MARQGPADCGMSHSEELQSDFFEVEPGRAKTVIKDLLLCAEFPISADDQNPSSEEIDAEYIPPAANRQLWGLRVFGYFIAFAPPTEHWSPPDPARASLRGTLVVRCLSPGRGPLLPPRL